MRAKDKISILLLGLSIILTSISCSKDNTILYDDYGMATIVDGQLLTDQGILLNVTENISDADYRNEKRIFAQYDILNKNSVSTYNIRLKKWSRVLYKKLLLASQLDDKIVGRDTTFILNAWTGGGNINILGAFPYHIDKKNIHHINIVYDDIKSSRDTLYFFLRRNSHGDPVSMDELMGNKENVALGKFYISSSYLFFAPNYRKVKVIVE